MTLTVFTPAALDRLRDLIARGYSTRGAAEVLGLKWTTVRHKVHELGLSKHRRDTRHRVRIGAEILHLLQRHADRRGVNVVKLCNQILSAIAFDNLVDAVIDDDFLRQGRITQRKVNRDAYQTRRRNGEPVLDPRAAALAGHRTALMNAGLLPMPSLPHDLHIAVDQPNIVAMICAPALIGRLEPFEIHFGSDPRSDAHGWATSEPGRVMAA